MGSGKYPLKDWTNVDLAGADIDLDLRAFPWPFKTAHYERLAASHILEHFTRDQGRQFIGECWRILRSGGLLHVAVPDMDRFIDCKLSGDYSPLEGYHWTSLDWMMGGDLSETVDAMRHKYMYCYASLAYELESAGFVVKRRPEPLPPIDNPRYRPISLYVDATKT